MNRRTFFRTSLQAAAGIGIASTLLPGAAKAAHRLGLFAHTLPPLPYAYDALKPAISEEIMRLHHGKHHQAYVDNLNKALANHADLAALSVEQLLAQLDRVPANIRTTVRNNGGGHANHSLSWTLLTPKPGRPPVRTLERINASFGTFSQFQSQFEAAAKGVFGSGWAWLVRQPDGKLAINTTANQDSPLMPADWNGGNAPAQPVLGLDVWEHAYYLQYQNRRPEYVSAFWSIVNWQRVDELLFAK